MLGGKAAVFVNYHTNRGAGRQVLTASLGRKRQKRLIKEIGHTPGSPTLATTVPYHLDKKSFTHFILFAETFQRPTNIVVSE